MKIRSVGASIDADGIRLLTITAEVAAGAEPEADDVAELLSALEEMTSTLNIEEDEEPQPARPRRRRAAKDEEEEEEQEEEEEEQEDEDEEEEEKPARRRRRAAKDDDEDEEEEEKPARRRRRAAKDDEEEEEEEEKPKKQTRSRKSAAKSKAPSADDAKKVASLAAAELGTKFLKGKIVEYSEDGTIDGIPAGDRQAFMDDLNAELAEE